MPLHVDMATRYCLGLSNPNPNPDPNQTPILTKP